MSTFSMASLCQNSNSKNDFSNNNIALDHNIDSIKVRKIISARSFRRGHFGDLFFDPAWDILLELYASYLEQQRHTIGSLCAVIDVPMTTLLRWLSALASEHFVLRSGDPLDSRRVFISLSHPGRSAMHGYFQEICAISAVDPIAL